MFQCHNFCLCTAEIKSEVKQIHVYKPCAPGANAYSTIPDSLQMLRALKSMLMY